MSALPLPQGDCSYGEEREGKKSSVCSVSDVMKLGLLASSPSTEDVSPITTSQLMNSHFGPDCLQDVRTNIKTYFEVSTNCTNLLVRPWSSLRPPSSAYTSLL